MRVRGRENTRTWSRQSREERAKGTKAGERRECEDEGTVRGRGEKGGHRRLRERLREG